MAAIEKKPIKITETVLRDAHQSLIATRLTTEQMLPIVDKMDKVGYHSVECWGGATSFANCIISAPLSNTVVTELLNASLSDLSFP